MLVCMLSTHTGAVDAAGTISKVHKIGEVYDIPESVAKVYIDAGYATGALLVEPEVTQTVEEAIAEGQDKIRLVLELDAEVAAEKAAEAEWEQAEHVKVVKAYKEHHPVAVRAGIAKEKAEQDELAKAKADREFVPHVPGAKVGDREYVPGEVFPARPYAPVVKGRVINPARLAEPIGTLPVVERVRNVQEEAEYDVERAEIKAARKREAENEVEYPKQPKRKR